MKQVLVLLMIVRVDQVVMMLYLKVFRSERHRAHDGRPGLARPGWYVLLEMAALYLTLMCTLCIFLEMYVCIYVHVCVCTCVCRVCARVCMCVCHLLSD